METFIHYYLGKLNEICGICRNIFLGGAYTMLAIGIIFLER